ncbi:MAG TPA: flagellar basal-body rod protein FlgF [Terriglobales bacterium]|nr:flagellar basal-body rod protein FlgF [Terriglobales bacterium]
MDSGYYAACTALLAQSQSLDVVANNLANTATPGYRSQEAVFRSVLAKAGGYPMSALNKATNDYGVLGGSSLDFAQGGLQKTGNNLDFAIEGSGFFVVQTAGGRLYTRAGNFQVSHGQLATADGSAVLGENGLIPIVGAPVEVSADGTISVNGAVAGKLKVVDFKPGTSLQSVGGTYYSAPNGSEVPATAAQIRQGMLEDSNVNAMADVVELITVQRSFDMAQKALSLFDSQFNKTATEDLPRVSS